jgi:membrane fusion protein, multidrug efflux system
VVNVVERDLRMVSAGDPAEVEVDAYPGEKFSGKIARVAPVLDPATRTATMEVEIPNGDNKLKPGMYARINLTVEDRKGALVVPKSAVIDFENKRGVWSPNDENRAKFVPVTLGIEGSETIEILTGLKEGDKFVTTGAAAVRNNDQLLIAGEAGRGGQGGRGAGGEGARKFQGGQRPEGTTGQPGAPGGQPRKRPQGQ